FSSRRRHTRFSRDWSSDVCSSDLLAYRGWSYFQMVQLFGERFVKGQANSGLAVSLVTKPSTAAVARNTVQEVYTQINADLQQARSEERRVGKECRAR